jgi:hypothetical protein
MNHLVKVPLNNQGWCWNDNQWAKWCKINCRGSYDVNSYLGNKQELYATFEFESDATMFALRWS